MTEPDLLFTVDMDSISSIYQDEGLEQEEPMCRRVFDSRVKTYVSPVNIKKIKATEDIPQALEMEVVRGGDDDLCEGDVFRRSSLLMHSPLKKEEEKRTGPTILKVGSLPKVGELKPIVVLERMLSNRPGRASTPLELTRTSEGEESVAIIGDLTVTQGEMELEEEDDASETSSIIFAPFKTHKRGRGVLSELATAASVTGDEGSVSAPEERPKKRKPGRPRTTNVIDKIKTRREKREKERQQEREE